MMRCSNCGSENPASKKFCGDCGAPLAHRCSNCGSENPAGKRFCGECGSALFGNVQPGAAQPAGTESSAPDIRIASGHTYPSPAPDGERKTVTALFADIKGSMELMEDLDPEEARAIVDPALKLMIEAVRLYGGYVVQSTGDGIFALFGAPLAHEDHPQRALYAALRLQEEMRRYSARLRQAGNLPVEARVGVNTGEVVVRSITTGENRPEYTPIGHSTSLAARMQALAPTGSIAVTDGTRKLCEGYFTFRTLGPARVKGVSEPVEVFEVIGLGPLRTRLQVAARRGLTKFVGREREMEALRHAAELAQTGHGQVLAVMAEPGVGKSRLFHEFKLVSQSEWMTLEAFSVSYGRATAYLPVLELLREYFRITATDDLRTRREKVTGRILALDRSLEDTLSHLFALLGLSEDNDQLAQMGAQVRRRRMHEAIKRVLLRESLNQPLMVIFEDLHWIDGETQILLNLLVDSLATARILLLVNYRPEYRHEWGNRTHYTQLRLDPLEFETGGEMLSALLGNTPGLDPLKRLIVERTQGNPFFMEEMTQALLDEGALIRDGEVKLARPLDDLKIPPTVQAMLAARIDRLPPAEKELLQTLAVIGKEPELRLIEKVTAKSAEELEPMLSNLQLSEFIYEQPSVDGPAYTFKHALTQEVTFNSILAQRRRLIHEQTARAIEALYEGQLEDHYSELARHHLQGTDTAKTVHYAQLAAEQALLRGTYAEATSLIEAALKLLNRLPEGNERSRAELALRGIESTIAFVQYGGGSQERERAISRMCELGEELGEADQLLRGLIILCNLYFVRGESAHGLEHANRCVELGQARQNARLLVDAHYVAGVLAFSCGKLREAVSHLEDAALLSSRTHHQVSPIGFHYLSTIPCMRARTLQLLGRVDEAINLAEQGLRQARESRHLFTLGFALVMKADLAHNCREREVALAYSEETIALSEENGFTPWLNVGRFNRGWALAELRQLEQGITEMETAIDGIRRAGGNPFLQYFITLLAQAYARRGQTEKGLTMMNEALQHIERTGQKAEHVEMLRLNGEMLLMRDAGATTEAEYYFRAALGVARAQEAKWWELRTSVSLARLLRDTNRRDEARTILTEIYNWFTEGFELADLMEAKALLDELGSERP